MRRQSIKGGWAAQKWLLNFNFVNGGQHAVNGKIYMLWFIGYVMFIIKFHDKLRYHVISLCVMSMATLRKRVYYVRH